MQAGFFEFNRIEFQKWCEVLQKVKRNNPLIAHAIGWLEIHVRTANKFIFDYFTWSDYMYIINILEQTICIVDASVECWPYKAQDQITDQSS